MTGVALVTGAARRLGRAIALDLASAGWDVAVHYRESADDAAELVERIGRLGRRAVALQCDLAEEAACERLLPAATDALGPVTLLVNNAALFDFDLPETATRARWDAHMDVNLRAPLVLARVFAGLLPADASGNIVNMIDSRVLNLTPNYTSYSVSKAGLWVLTRMLALNLAPRIRVNAIGPGLALRDPGRTAEAFERMSGSMPLGRGTNPEEICRTLRFILDSPALTGQMIALDGGQHLGWLVPGLGPD
jgi:NAD(P)-dependent dehydrogenase (short-subunit alcohol dehydrogenase family)